MAESDVLWDHIEQAYEAKRSIIIYTLGGRERTGFVVRIGQAFIIFKADVPGSGGETIFVKIPLSSIDFIEDSEGIVKLFVHSTVRTK